MVFFISYLFFERTSFHFNGIPLWCTSINRHRYIINVCIRLFIDELAYWFKPFRVKGTLKKMIKTFLRVYDFYLICSFYPVVWFFLCPKILDNVFNLKNYLIVRPILVIGSKCRD